jgi:hypothetical protein
MKKLLSLVCLVLLLQFMMGCHLAANSIHHIWFFTYSDGPGKDTLINPASFLECRTDGSYTRDFGHFEYGTWRLDDKKLYLTDHLQHTTIYPVDMTRPNEMQMTIKEGFTAHFERQPLPDQKEGMDPFSRENNRWRVPATHKESDAEIHQRLYNHCAFWVAYFKWALDNEVSAIDVRGTPTNIKIYGNGFTLKPLDELPSTWKSYFFDQEDCAKANDIIKEIFRSGSIAWPHTDNRFKQFVGAFQQLENSLR